MKQKINIYNVEITAIHPEVSVINGIVGPTEQSAIISAFNSQDFIGIKNISVKKIKG